MGAYVFLSKCKKCNSAIISYQNKKHTKCNCKMKKSSIKLFETYISINHNNIYIPTHIMEQIKEIHKKEIIKFAEDWKDSKLDSMEDLYKETFE